MKIMLESTIQGGKAEERITRLQTAMQDLPEPMRPMMEVVLANWYWNYFQQNRWRFLQRTQTGASIWRRHPDLGPTPHPGRNRHAFLRPH